VVMSGWMGVDLFFALSGFLITSLLLREEHRHNGVFSLKNFYFRRALRILPPYLLVMLLNGFVFSAIPNGQSAVPAIRIIQTDPLTFVALMTLWWNYYAVYAHSAPVGIAGFVTWSLCIEEHFYLFWPPLLRVLRKASLRRWLALGICVTVLLMRCAAAAWHLDSPLRMRMVTHYRVDGILLGALMALMGDLVPWARLRRAMIGITAALVAGLVLHGDLSVFPPGTMLGVSAGQSVVAVCCALIVADVAASPSSPLVRCLEWEPLRAVGRISYGIYLLHVQMLDVAGWMVSSFRVVGLTRYGVVAGLGTLFAIASATLMYRQWEMRFLALKGRLSA